MSFRSSSNHHCPVGKAIHLCTTCPCCVSMRTSKHVSYSFLEFFLQLKGWADDYQSKGIFILWLCNKPSVIVYKPEYVEVILFFN